MKVCAIGIDIGGTNFRIGLVDSNGNLDCFQKYSSSLFQNEDGLEILTKTIKNYQNENRTSYKIKAVSIGIPGTVSKDKRKIFGASYFKSFSGIDIKSYLETELGCPVYIDRDANFLLFNDICHYRNVYDFDSMEMVTGIYFGTAIANAFYIKGNFYDGVHGVAGEICHSPLYGVEEICQCGKKGCMAVRNGGRYLQQLIEKNYENCSIEQVFQKHVYDPVIRKFVEDMAIPVVQIENILDPDLVFLGGGVINIKGFPFEFFRKKIEENTRYPMPATDLNIVHATHTSSSGVIGAGYYAMTREMK